MLKITESVRSRAGVGVTDRLATESTPPTPANTGSNTLPQQMTISVTKLTPFTEGKLRPRKGMGGGDGCQGF